jgi:hypothetical protein
VTANIDINLPIISLVLKRLISFYPTQRKPETNYTINPIDYSYAVHLFQSLPRPNGQYRGDWHQNQDSNHHRAPQHFKSARHCPNDYDRYLQAVLDPASAPRVISNDPANVQVTRDTLKDCDGEIIRMETRFMSLAAYAKRYLPRTLGEDVGNVRKTLKYLRKEINGLLGRQWPRESVRQR